MTVAKTVMRVTLALTTMALISFVLDLIGIYGFIALESENQLRECQEAKMEDRRNIGKRLEVKK